MSEAFTDTSNSAITFFDYLSSMSYMEGKEERYALFDNKTYDDLYLQFGGHIHFYVELWMVTNNLRSCDEAYQVSSYTIQRIICVKFKSGDYT